MGGIYKAHDDILALFFGVLMMATVAYAESPREQLQLFYF